MSGQPIFFGSPETPLFGWYHSGAPEQARRVAVVLCPPLALDFMSAYRSWRILAERLAAAGFAVLRPEYRGTGNSAGDARDSAQVRGWEASIASAAQELARRSRTEKLVLVGLRLGANLAAQVARELGASDSLVLWSPLQSGKAYLREVRALVALSATDGYSEVDGELSAAGFLFTRSTAEELAALDLLALTEPPARRVLLIEEDERTSTRRVADRLRELGSEVSFTQLPGTAETLLGANYAKVPAPILDCIAGWLESSYPIRGPDGPGPPDVPSLVEVRPLPAVRERAVQFGPEARMFGMLSEPAEATQRDTAVILLNTGCNHHVGPHRMFVPLARECAALGFPAFRFDFGGIGASLPPPGIPDNIPYPRHASDDISLALETVRRETGAARMILVGLCSGGWQALGAARQGLPIDGLIAVNPPLYYKGGDPDEAKEAEEESELFRYRRSLVEPGKWKKLLRGQVHVTTFLRLALGHVRRSARARLLPLATDPGPETTAAELTALSRASFPVLLVFDREDPSYRHFELHLPWRLRRKGRSLKWIVVEGAGDTFKPIAAQQRLRELVTGSLREWAG